jgi:hypothetical protein
VNHVQYIAQRRAHALVIPKSLADTQATFPFDAQTRMPAKEIPLCIAELVIAKLHVQRVQVARMQPLLHTLHHHSTVTQQAIVTKQSWIDLPSSHPHQRNQHHAQQQN